MRSAINEWRPKNGSQYHAKSRFSNKTFEIQKMAVKCQGKRKMFFRRLDFLKFKYDFWTSVLCGKVPKKVITCYFDKHLAESNYQIIIRDYSRLCLILMLSSFKADYHFCGLQQDIFLHHFFSAQCIINMRIYVDLLSK